MLSIIDLFSVCAAEIAFVDAKRPLVPVRAGFPVRVGAGGQGHPQLQLSRSPAGILARGGGGEEKKPNRLAAQQPRPGPTRRGLACSSASRLGSITPARCSPEPAAEAPRAQVIVVFAFQPLLYICVTEYGGGLF